MTDYHIWVEDLIDQGADWYKNQNLEAWSEILRGVHETQVSDCIDDFCREYEFYLLKNFDIDVLYVPTEKPLVKDLKFVEANEEALVMLKLTIDYDKKD